MLFVALIPVQTFINLHFVCSFMKKMLTSCTNSYCHDLMHGTCSSFLFSFEMETYNSFYQEILTALSTCFVLLWEHRQCCCAFDPDIVCGFNIIDNYFVYLKTMYISSFLFLGKKYVALCIYFKLRICIAFFNLINIILHLS